MLVNRVINIFVDAEAPSKCASKNVYEKLKELFVLYPSVSFSMIVKGIISSVPEPEAAVLTKYIRYVSWPGSGSSMLYEEGIRVRSAPHDVSCGIITGRPGCSGRRNALFQAGKLLKKKRKTRGGGRMPRAFFRK